METFSKLTEEEKQKKGSATQQSMKKIKDFFTCCESHKCHTWASRRRHIVETLYRSCADIICLQEVQVGSGEPTDTEYEKEEIMIVHAAAQNDEAKKDAVEIALKKCTDWLFRYKKQTVITKILKEMAIYDSVRGTQCITMKMCDIFELSASSIDWFPDNAQAKPPGNITENMLRDFGLRGQEPRGFLDKLNSIDWSELKKKGDKLAQITKILDEMETVPSLEHANLYISTCRFFPHL